MERVVHVAKNHESARRWDLRQQRLMTPDERRAVAKALRERVFGTGCPDVRACERSRSWA